MAKRELRESLKNEIDNLFNSPELAEDNFQRATKRRRSVPSSPISRRKTENDGNNGPKLLLRLCRLNDGQRIDCENLASLIHFTVFGSMLQKPKWVALSHHRSVLQTLVIRVNVEDDFFATTNLSFPNAFFDKQWIELDGDVSDRELFWKSAMNVRLTLQEQIRRKSEKMQKTFEEVGQHDKLHFVLSTEQMADRSFPFPGEEDVVTTKNRYRKLSHTSPLFSLDCEMCETNVENRALTRISIIDESENTILDTLVKPEGRIIDYVTRYSGITAEMMEGVTTSLHDVQQAVQYLLPPDAILVGHSLEHDLQALKMAHPYCLDVGHVLNYANSGLRNSLKNLTELFLGEQIQNEFGHCSYEDAWAAMRLARLKLEKGLVFGNTSYGWKYEEYAKATVKVSEAREHPKELVTSCSECLQPTVVGCSVQNCRCKSVTAPGKCVKCVTRSEIVEGDFDWKESLPLDLERSTSPIESYLRKEKLKTVMCAFDGTGIDMQTGTKKIRCKPPASFPSYSAFLDNVASEMLNDSLILLEIDKEKVEPLESSSEVQEGELADNAEALNEKLEKLVAATSKNALVMMIFSSSNKNILYIFGSLPNYIWSDSCFFLRFDSPLVLLFLAVGYCNITFMFTQCSIAFYVSVKSMKMRISQMSAKTMEMQRNLLKSLVIMVAVHCIFIAIPMFMFLMGHLIFFPFSWMPFSLSMTILMQEHGAFSTIAMLLTHALLFRVLKDAFFKIFPFLRKSTTLARAARSF